jgi:hypothetical protein
MDIIRFTRRFRFRPNDCTLDKFIEMVKQEMKENQIEDVDESLIKLEFDSDYDTSCVNIDLLTPETAEEMVERVKEEQSRKARIAEENARQDKVALERLAKKYGYALSKGTT